MPPLVEPTKPTWSVARWIGMLTLCFYLVIAVVLMVPACHRTLAGEIVMPSVQQPGHQLLYWLEWEVDVQ
jgi:hypothetical protein